MAGPCSCQCNSLESKCCWWWLCVFEFRRAHTSLSNMVPSRSLFRSRWCCSPFSVTRLTDMCVLFMKCFRFNVALCFHRPRRSPCAGCSIRFASIPNAFYLYGNWVSKIEKYLFLFMIEWCVVRSSLCIWEAGRLKTGMEWNDRRTVENQTCKIILIKMPKYIYRRWSFALPSIPQPLHPTVGYLFSSSSSSAALELNLSCDAASANMMADIFPYSA